MAHATLHIYRDYIIECFAWPAVVDRLSAWAPCIQITRRLNGAAKSQTFTDIPLRFGEKRVAVRFAQRIGEYLVDGKVPGLAI